MDTQGGCLIHPDAMKQEERQGQLMLATCKGASIGLHVCPTEFVRGEQWRQKGRETGRRELVSSCTLQLWICLTDRERTHWKPGVSSR